MWNNVVTSRCSRESMSGRIRSVMTGILSTLIRAFLYIYMLCVDISNKNIMYYVIKLQIGTTKRIDEHECYVSF